MNAGAILAAAVTLAIMDGAPLAAQDHQHGEAAPAPEMDHCAMGHLPPEQCPPASATQDETSDMDHSAHGMGMAHTMPAPSVEGPPPARAFEGPRHAADAVWGEQAMAPSRRQLAAENGGMKTGMILVERLEARFAADGGEDGYVWDAQGWYGGDINRLALKTEGQGAFGEALEDAEIQALYSRAIGPFFDLQAGVRLDVEPETRSHLVLGVQGLAPYMFHVDAAAFVSDRGDVTARIEAEYDQKLTQQLILQPRVELELSAQDIPERGVGAGLAKAETGLRLRYEIVREFAPYIGVEYEFLTGDTADFARAEGEDTDGIKILAGIRAWF